MWNEAPCPICKTISTWSEYFKKFWCNTCEKGFYAPERRVNKKWEDQEILAGAIKYLVELTDQQQKLIDELKQRIHKIESKSNLNLRV